MKHRITYLIAAVALSAIASVAAADCTVEYKAKKDSPLRLDYGTVTVSGPCNVAEVTPKAQSVLASRGWTLLKVLSVSGN
ncbi:MAG: hypothetical protein WBC85_00355 [Planktotalea sp.]|uniref:hypothetical protein n=1 Tax=Planktotalea sp. TaxID=2029877 RepID=UPI003C783F33